MSELLNTEFENCRPQLRSYIFRMTASIQDTEDIIQDTYLKAVSHIDSFKAQSSLKTWIFAIFQDGIQPLFQLKETSNKESTSGSNPHLTLSECSNLKLRNLNLKQHWPGAMEKVREPIQLPTKEMVCLHFP